MIENSYLHITDKSNIVKKTKTIKFGFKLLAAATSILDNEELTSSILDYLVAP